MLYAAFSNIQGDSDRLANYIELLRQLDVERVFCLGNVIAPIDMSAKASPIDANSANCLRLIDENQELVISLKGKNERDFLASEREAGRDNTQIYSKLWSLPGFVIIDNDFGFVQGYSSHGATPSTQAHDTFLRYKRLAHGLTICFSGHGSEQACYRIGEADARPIRERKTIFEQRSDYLVTPSCRASGYALFDGESVRLLE